MRIIKEECIVYYRSVVGYYVYDGLENMNCANGILKLLENAGVEFGEFYLSYEYDHCDYKGTLKYDDYNDFLKSGGMLRSLEELDSFEFEFYFNGIAMTGAISIMCGHRGYEGGSFIVKAFYKRNDAEGKITAEKVLDKIKDIVEVVTLDI